MQPFVMFLPCELIVADILPTARGAIAMCLVEEHGYTQVRVAEAFGVTGSAVSQYLKGTRGGSELIENSPNREGFYKMIEKAAATIADGYNVTEVLCSICGFVKKSGMIEELYGARGCHGLPAACLECPRFNISIT